MDGAGVRRDMLGDRAVARASWVGGCGLGVGAGCAPCVHMLPCHHFLPRSLVHGVVDRDHAAPRAGAARRGRPRQRAGLEVAVGQAGRKCVPWHVLLVRLPALPSHGIEEHLLAGVHPRAVGSALVLGDGIRRRDWNRRPLPVGREGDSAERERGRDAELPPRRQTAG